MQRSRFGFLLSAVLFTLVTSGCIIVASGVDQYSPCVGAGACNNGTSCQNANLMVSSSAGRFCSASCVVGGSCPVDSSLRAAVCVVVSGAGQCYQDCTGGGGCPTGTTCASAVAGGPMVCVPGTGTPTCGGSGQACCSGSVCNSGLACAGTTCVAPPAAYEGCTAASIGATCGGGTTCQRPMIANPGSAGWCSRACNALPSECPAFAGMTYNCYQLQGATGGQCYVDCPAGSGCPTGTVCLMTNTMTASGVRLCMPPAT